MIEAQKKIRRCSKNKLKKLKNNEKKWKILLDRWRRCSCGSRRRRWNGAGRQRLHRIGCRFPWRRVENDTLLWRNRTRADAPPPHSPSSEAPSRSEARSPFLACNSELTESQLDRFCVSCFYSSLEIEPGLLRWEKWKKERVRNTWWPRARRHRFEFGLCAYNMYTPIRGLLCTPIFFFFFIFQFTFIYIT